MDRLELAQKEAELLEAGIPYAAVTLVESSGTARTEGKMLVLSADTIFGTIGGGAGEQLAHRDALSLLAEGKNAVRHYELDSPLSAEGKACGGSLTVFIESCRSARPQLVMVGGGHVGLALLRAARLAGFATTLLVPEVRIKSAPPLPLPITSSPWKISAPPWPKCPCLPAPTMWWPPSVTPPMVKPWAGCSITGMPPIPA